MISPTQATEAASVQEVSLPDSSTAFAADVSEDAVRGRRASRVPRMCPECVRVLNAQTT